MTKKRCCLLSSCIVAVCVSAVFFVLAILPPSRVTKANFDRIEDGMPMAQVEEIFGCRPSASCNILEHFPNGDSFDRYVWRSSDGHEAIVDVLTVGANNKVTSKDWSRSTETITERFFRWLGLRA